MTQADDSEEHATIDRAWQHSWLRIQRLIRSILEVRRDAVTRPVMKQTLRGFKGWITLRMRAEPTLGVI